jgi:hypothetical protein
MYVIDEKVAKYEAAAGYRVKDCITFKNNKVTRYKVKDYIEFKNDKGQEKFINFDLVNRLCGLYTVTAVGFINHPYFTDKFYKHEIDVGFMKEDRKQIERIYNY